VERLGRDSGNHNRKKWVAQQACDIADCLENELWNAKQSQL